MEDKDENWIPCFGERCKGRTLCVYCASDNRINFVACGDSGYNIFFCILYKDNGEMYIEEDDLHKCIYSMEWHVCGFGSFKNIDGMIEKLQRMGFEVGTVNEEEGKKYIKYIRKTTGDKNEKDS